MSMYKVLLAVGPNYDSGVGVRVIADSEDEAKVLGLEAGYREVVGPYELKVAAVKLLEA